MSPYMEKIQNRVFMPSCILISTVLLFTAPGASQQGEQLITLNLTQVSLKNTLELLTNRLGKNLLLDPGVSDKTLDLSLKRIKPIDAFNAILEAHELAFKEMEGNVFFVAKADKIGKLTVVKSIPLKYGSAVDLEPILSNMVVSDFGQIMADKRTNTLIIKESPDIIYKMEKMIAELDKPTKQIYIQAEIVEISASDDSELGVQWLWNNTDKINSRVGTQFNLQKVENLVDAPTGPVDNFPFPVGSGLGIGILKTDVEAVLHALSTTNDINLLSRPRIMTLDNQEAIIEVGDQIPYKKLNQFGVVSFEFKDATVQLVVKPHIVDSDNIILQVSQKADFANGFTPDGTPIISTRKASTMVKVKNGQTIVIGGLMRDSMVKSESKVPVLGSIPILGLLFRNKKTTRVKTELIIFIRPIIVEEGMVEDVFEEEFNLKNNVEKKLK